MPCPASRFAVHQLAARGTALLKSGYGGYLLGLLERRE